MIFSEAIQEPLLLESSQWFGKLIGESYGRTAIDKFLNKHGQNAQYGLHCVLLTIISSKTTSSRMYSKHILEAFNKLFSIRKCPKSKKILKLSSIELEKLDNVLFYIF